MELLIALTLLLVVMTAVAATVGALGRHQTLVQRQFAELDRAQVAAEVMSRDLHAAVSPSSGVPAFSVASSSQATFTASLGNATGPSLVAITLDPSAGGLFTLTVSVTPPDPGSGPAYTYRGAASVVVTSDVDTSNGPLLGYYDGSGNLLTAPVANPSAIAAVGFSLVVHDGPDPVTVADEVTVMNTAYMAQQP